MGNKGYNAWYVETDWEVVLGRDVGSGCGPYIWDRAVGPLCKMWGSDVGTGSRVEVKRRGGRRIYFACKTDTSAPFVQALHNKRRY